MKRQLLGLFAGVSAFALIASAALAAPNGFYAGGTAGVYYGHQASGGTGYAYGTPETGYFFGPSASYYQPLSIGGVSLIGVGKVNLLFGNFGATATQNFGSETDTNRHSIDSAASVQLGLAKEVAVIGLKFTPEVDGGMSFAHVNDTWREVFSGGSSHGASSSYCSGLNWSAGASAEVLNGVFAGVHYESTTCQSSHYVAMGTNVTPYSYHGADTFNGVNFDIKIKV